MCTPATKSLTLSARGLPFRDIVDVNQHFQRVLKQMPNLEVFESMPHAAPSSRHSTSPSIKEQDPSAPSTHNARTTSKHTGCTALIRDSTPPHRLHSLTVHNIYNHQGWTVWIAEVLRRSPDLHTLSLSLCPDMTREVSPQIAQGGTTLPIVDFFASMCFEFATGFDPELPAHLVRNHAGRLPRPAIRRLHCGHGVYRLSRALIARAINVSALEEVHVDSRTVVDPVTGWAYFDSWLHQSEVAIYGTLLDLVVCPNMRRLSVYQLTANIVAILRRLKEEKPQALERLWIGFVELEDGVDVEGLPCFRMEA